MMKSQKLVIVGGVAGGATAAARARRLDEFAEIVVLERGDYISFANCGLPYYIGGAITRRDDLLVTTSEAMRKRYRIDVRTGSEVLSIDRELRQVEVRNLADMSIYREDYDVLILSPGAEPIRPELPGIDSKRIFTIRNIPDTDRIKNFVDSTQPKRAVVVGGGFIGLEMAENLVELGVETTIVEMAPQVMTTLDVEMAALVHAHLVEKGVRLELGNSVTGFREDEAGIVVLTDKDKQWGCDLVILAVGVRPENKLAREAGLELGARGGILTDSAMRTSDPNILAVGDAVEVRNFVDRRGAMIPLAGPANKQGRIAADTAMRRDSRFPGSLGTSIVKVFDLSVAGTGLNETALRQSATAYLKSYTDGQSHASYYPGAELMMIKLLFSPGDGTLLGAQAVGGKGVDKRIDVLATAIRGGMTVYDLEELELAYAPPFSSAKDPVNVAGFHAANILNGDVKCRYWHEINGLDRDTTTILDVRTTGEVEKEGIIEGAENIPIDELRERVDELDPSRTYVLYCLAGLRSYLGCRILTANGFDCYSLSGGYGLYIHTLES